MENEFFDDNVSGITYLGKPIYSIHAYMEDKFSDDSVPSIPYMGEPMLQFQLHLS